MSRSPLAYPLNRAADMDVGGAADLQTDVMRFMAILALCLVAIFALVQSIPLTPAEAQPEPDVVTPAPVPPAKIPKVAPEPPPEATPSREEKAVVLTRPKWVPKYPVESTPVRETPVVLEEPVVETAPTESPPPADPPPSASPEKEGFTLRFASDAALTRAVAAHHVGLYALEASGAKRMTVSESRISFWDASTPNAFHEMEATTVPAAVVSALARTGTEPGNVNWGVTLPGKMSAQLDSLMQQHRGGSLIIAASGEIHWEAT
jgi:hypothetical protein